jgi:hypothetical protein
MHLPKGIEIRQKPTEDTMFLIEVPINYMLRNMFL